MSIDIVLFSSIIIYGSSIKVGSYNTYQFVTNPLASTLKDPQIEQIGQSDLDVVCLQELVLLSVERPYIESMAEEGYTESFSIFNVLQQDSPQNLITPRIPCIQQQIDAINSTCSQQCQPLYGQQSYFACLASLCPSDYDQIIYSECNGCLIAYLSIQPLIAAIPEFTLDFGGAAQFCLNPPDLSSFPSGSNFQLNLYNLTDGVAIISKPNYPIKNTWSFILPSFLFGERRVYIAEIDVCVDTDPYNTDCIDSIIVGCTHLEPTAFINDENITQSPRLNEPGVTSHIGLNRLQTQYIVDNIYNDDIISLLERDENADNIYGVFLMGDTNNGELFSRCHFIDDNGENNADNCELPDDQPLNPYDIWSENDLIDARDIKFRAKQNEGVKCTVCLDPTDDDFNSLTIQEGSGFISDPSTSSDLDHIFIQNGYCKNFKKISFARDFLDRVVQLEDSGELVPASDHYAVTLDIAFKKNKGGRCDERNCLRSGYRKKK